MCVCDLNHSAKEKNSFRRGGSGLRAHGRVCVACFQSLCLRVRDVQENPIKSSSQFCLRPFFISFSLFFYKAQGSLYCENVSFHIFFSLATRIHVVNSDRIGWMD